MTNRILIGYRGTGKTTLGRLLAARMGWAFIDADDEVERRAGKCIADIFAAAGETAVGDLEQEVVADLVSRQEHVISLGGGAILREDNRAAIRAGGGTVVWLTASPATIHARLTSDASTRERRPNLTAVGGLAEIEQLLTQRDEFYRACADVQVCTEDIPLDEVAARILTQLS